MTETGGADQFLDTIRIALDDPHPLPLLQMASAIVATLGPRRQRGIALSDFCQSLLTQGAGPSLALAAVVGELAGDDALRARIQHELAALDYPIPGWIRQLDHTTVSGVMAMSDVLGDGENIVIEATVPGNHTFSVVAYVDHNMGTVVKDGFVLPAPLDQVRAAWQRAEDEQPDLIYGSITSEISPADARARLTDAVDTGHRFETPIETENWPACEPLLVWVLGMLPEGGSGYPFADLQGPELVVLREKFFDSTSGTALDTMEHRILLDDFLAFASSTANGDALRWSAVSAEIVLMDWLPRSRASDIHLFDEAPEILRALIRFSHGQRGIARALTDETVAAVDLWEPQFRALIAEGARSGSDAGPDGSEEITEEQYYGYLLDAMSDEVGGADALMTVGVSPLPAEPFDWSEIAEDIVPRVAEILDQVDVAVPALFGRSHRSDGKPTEYPVDELSTACRRFLSRVAAADPQLFRRKGATKSFAAAVVWVVGKANEVVGQYWVQSKELLAHFGVGTVTQRADSMLAAVGANRQYNAMGMGDAALLTSSTRRRIIAERDDALARLAGVSEPESRA